jgi:hypothetical protein
MLLFCCGAVAGTTFGVLIMACVALAKDADARENVTEKDAENPKHSADGGE